VGSPGPPSGGAPPAAPAAAAPAALLALDATLHTTGGPSRRSIQARRFFVDAYETALGPTEVLTEIRIPKQPARTGSTYLKFANKASRFAIVGVAAAVTVDRRGVCTRARIAVTGAGPRAVRAAASERHLTGREISADAIAAAAARASRGMEFIEDIHGSEEYREHLTGVITQRALTEAARRAGA
ncbi:MAG: FAD binding domain-containing protein, partial [Chloroflexi bacterium]|nr:FAD binding domain-containing protein [Chloroflexota bacterium]